MIVSDVHHAAPRLIHPATRSVHDHKYRVHLPSSQAIGTDVFPIFCTIAQNANGPFSEQRFIRITHPFHPLYGNQYLLVGFRYNRYGRRALLEIEEGVYRTIPLQWTDLSPPDPEIAISEIRSFYRASDLIELARMIDCQQVLKENKEQGDV